LVKTSIAERWIGNDMDDPLYGWRASVSGAIEVCTVPGEHLTLFEEANQRRISDAVSQAIDSRAHRA
jgi:thioesterase domain-containing protein